MDKEFEKSVKAYEGFFKQYNESKEKLKELKEKFADIEFSSEYIMYEKAMNTPGLTEEEKEKLKADMYKTEWEETEKEISSLEEKIDPFVKLLKESAIDLDSKIQEAIAKVNEKIETRNKQIEESEKAIQAKKEELKVITESEAYKAGEVEEVEKANNLQIDIESADKKLETSKKSIESFKMEIDKYNQQREKIKTELEEIGLDNVIKDKKGPEKKEDNDPKKNEDNDPKKNEKKDKKKITRGGNIVETIDTELTEEQKAEIERVKKEKEFKEKFESLCKKMKKRKFKEEDFEELVAIMKDKENYDKLGITTGIVFNKAEKIFATLKKSAKKDHEKTEKIDEAYKTYQEVFFERNDKKKIERGFKIYSELGGVTKKQYQNALPTPKGTTREDKDEFFKKLFSQVEDKPKNIDEKKKVITKDDPIIS